MLCRSLQLLVELCNIAVDFFALLRESLTQASFLLFKQVLRVLRTIHAQQTGMIELALAAIDGRTDTVMDLSSRFRIRLNTTLRFGGGHER